MSKSSVAPKPSSRRGPIVAIIVAAVVIAVAIAVLAGGKKKDEAATAGGGTTAAGTAQVHPVTITGAALPKLADPAADPAVGTKPPELSGQSFDGSAVSIVPGGKAKLVVFLAHWCPHCQREVPHIVEWMATKPASVDVIAVSTAVSSSRDNYPPSAWLDREKLVVPTLTDDEDSSAAVAWGLPGYPYLVVLRADGTVAARTSGELDVAELDAFVRKGLGIS